jgi:hypothetical protein
LVDDIVKLMYIRQNLLEGAGYILGRVVDKSEADYIVKQLEMVIGKIIQIREFWADCFVFFLNYPEEKIVFECF